MNHQSTGSRSSNPQQKQQPAVQSLQLVVFEIGTLKFALPIEFTYKIVNYKAMHGSGLNHIGVTHVDNFEVTVVDLHRRFFQAKQAQESPTTNCLVIVQSPKGELFGIPTVDIPTLMEVPISMIRVLPDSYRRADTLDLAKYVVVVPQETGTLTIFLLDIDRLVPDVQRLQLSGQTH